MKSLKVILSLAILTIFVSASFASALSWSSFFSTDFVRVREKWSYQEDTTGKLRGFNLIHTFFVPRDTIEQRYNDKPTSTNTQVVSGNGLVIGGGFGSSGTSSSGGFGSGVVGLPGEFNRGSSGSSFGSGSNNYGLTNDQAISDAFDTFRQNNGGSGGGIGFSGGVRW